MAAGGGKHWKGESERCLWPVTSFLFFLCCVAVSFGRLNILVTLFPIVRNKKNLQNKRSLLPGELVQREYFKLCSFLLPTPFQTIPFGKSHVGARYKQADLCLVSLITS